MVQMVGSFAELERAIIRERTSVGLAQARAESRIGGRRRKLDPKKRSEIAQSMLSGRGPRWCGFMSDGSSMSARATTLGQSWRVKAQV